MRNQTSFRLTTTLLPNDTTANTTTVINKLDSSGNKFYPTFTEETVVLTNDDRTIMETTRATCTNWVLTFVKRGLSDDVSATPIDNRKLTWNPWTLCFITAWAWDWIDKDDDITWTWDQTYTGNLVSTGNATYRWELTTEKWVKYPHFNNVSDLEACTWAFGWMFAVVDSSWELYRYNAVTEERALIESSTPANPEMADDETIWTVRIATDAEFEAWTDTGSHGEYLVATPSQIQGVSPDVDTKVFELDSTDDLTTWQAILDFCKSWWCPIIKRHTSFRYEFYYLDQDMLWDYLGFFRTFPSQSTTTGFDIQKAYINYSWTPATVTSISFS